MCVVGDASVDLQPEIKRQGEELEGWIFNNLCGNWRDSGHDRRRGSTKKMMAKSLERLHCALISALAWPDFSRVEASGYRWYVGRRSEEGELLRFVSSMHCLLRIIIHSARKTYRPGSSGRSLELKEVHIFGKLRFSSRLVVAVQKEPE